MIAFNLFGILIFVLNKFCICYGGKNTNCSIEELEVCGVNETCQQIKKNSTEGVCNCPPDFNRSYLSGNCVSDSQDTSHDFSNGVSASAIAVGLLVPVISILIIGGLVFAARRYQWIHRFRNQALQLTVRSYDTVLVGNEDDGSVG